MGESESDRCHDHCALVGALVAGFGFTEITDFFEIGIDRVLNVAIMFIFAILFFGVLQDTGFF